MKRIHLLGLLILLATGGAMKTAVAVDIKVDGAKRHQTIEGFGTCLIAWEEDFRKLYRTSEFQKLYVEGVGLNFLRVNMAGPTFEKPTADWTKIDYKDFDMSASDGRAQIFVDFAQGAIKLNPEFKIIGTVWSPPAWMKLNKSVRDTKSGAIRAEGYGDRNNRVDPQYYKHFCKWMVEYVKLHDKMGVPFYAVSPGNEVQFSQTYGSSVWSGQDLVTIIGMLSDTLREEGYGHVKIFAPETMTSHMYPGGTGDYVKMIMADEKAAAAIGAYATHGYEDGVKEEMSANSSRVFWNLIKDTGKPFWITEGGTGGHDWPVPIQKGVALAIHNALVAGNCSAFVPWQISERDRSTHALMHMSQYTPKTFAAMHYTKFVKPGAERVEAEPGFSPVMTGAFHHAKDGVLSLVIINSTNAEQPLNIVFENISGLKTMKQYRTSATENLKEIGEVKVENGKAALDIPALSMITLTGETDKQAEPAQKQPE